MGFPYFDMDFSILLFQIQENPFQDSGNRGNSAEVAEITEITQKFPF